MSAVEAKQPRREGRHQGGRHHRRGRRPQRRAVRRPAAHHRRDRRPGTAVKLKIWRQGDTREVSASLGEIPAEKVAFAADDPAAKPGKLGLAVRPLTAEERKQIGAEGGLLVETAEGPAGRAGVQPGDVILALNNQPVKDIDQLRRLVDRVARQRRAPYPARRHQDLRPGAHRLRSPARTATASWRRGFFSPVAGTVFRPRAARSAAVRIGRTHEEIAMAAPRPLQFDTLSLHAGQRARPARPARAPRRSISPPRSSSATPITPRRCSTWSAPATSIRASPIRPTRCSRSASPRSKAASPPSPPRAARRRCTSRSRPSPARARTSSPPRALYGGSHNLLALHPAALRRRDHLRQSARPRRLARGDPARTPGCCSPRRWAIPGLDVLDIPAVAAIAHEHGLPLLVDSTFTTPYLLQALRPRRRSALPLGDQVPRRPRRRHRRRAGRRRHASTGTRPGKFPELTEPYAAFTA